MFQQFFTKYKFQLIGILLGLVAGFLYYDQIGCVTGTCTITANPWLSSAYGGALGYFVAGIIAERRKPNFRDKS